MVLTRNQKIGAGIGGAVALLCLILVIYFATKKDTAPATPKTTPPSTPKTTPPSTPKTTPPSTSTTTPMRTTPPTPKPEVYVYDEGIYGIALTRAEDIAKNLNATLATASQLQEAQKAGADWCRWGWTSDSATIAYPLAGTKDTANSNCLDADAKAVSPGTRGKVFTSKRDQAMIPFETWAVVLYGIKPKEQPECKSALGVTKSFGNGCVLPFSSTKWSQYS
jgi:hypothetical protein